MQAVQSVFMQHIADHGLSYGTIEEYNFRLGLFSAIDAEIAAHNATDSTYTLGHNFLSTMTEGEKAKLRGYVAPMVPIEIKVFEQSNSAS